MRRSSRRDENEPDLVAIFEAHHAWVDKIDSDTGIPDLLVWFHGWHLVEVKNPAKVPSQRRLTEKQRAWHDACPGEKHIVETEEDCLSLLRSWSPAASQTLPTSAAAR